MSISSAGNCTYLKLITIELARNIESDTVNSPNNRSPNETVLDTQHVRVLLGVCHADVCELDVEVLIHTVKCPSNAESRKVAANSQYDCKQNSREVIFQFDDDILSNQRLEE